MALDRRAFCGGLGLLAVAAREGGASQAAEAGRGKLEAARWPAILAESDFYSVAADFDELRAIEAKVTPGDVQSLADAWTEEANALEEEAGRFEKAGRLVAAHENYTRASNYHHRAHIGWLRVGDGPRMLPPYLKMREAWKRAWKLATPPFESVDFRYRETTLPGMFVHADPPGRSKRPVVLVLGGSDHLNEKSYFRFEARRFNTRGVSYFTLDGPGQGEPMNLRKMFLVPDYENVTKAAIDYLASRPDVDASRIGVYGQAFSGYFAARAATDPRVRAVGCRSVSMDMLAECYDYGSAFRRQFEYMLGVPGPAEARQALAAYNLRGVAERIRVPIAIYHGAKDETQDARGAQRLYDAIPHQKKVLKIVPGAGRSVGREAEMELVDWLVAQLQA
jgi:dipeptidyl aminopeptidase/acylaminoacyl peptidase